MNGRNGQPAGPGANRRRHPASSRRGCLLPVLIGAGTALLLLGLNVHVLIIKPALSTRSILEEMRPRIFRGDLDHKAEHEACLSALRRLGDGDMACEKLRRYMGWPSRLLGCRATAIKVLGTTGEKAIPDMLFLFGDPNKYVRFLAESALARTWRSTSCRSYLLQELETAMSDPRWTVRFGALGVMEEAEIRDGRATAAMIASLRDAHPLIRQRAAFMLGKFDVAEAIPHLAPATSDLDERFRCLAAQSLGWIGGDEMSVGASFSEEHEDQVIVVSSVRSIGRRPENPEAVPAIVALLGFMEDTSPKVRKQVLDSLPGIETGLTAMHKATPEAQPALDRLRKLAARTDAVGQTARDALMLIDASGETDDAPDSQP